MTIANFYVLYSLCCLIPTSLVDRIGALRQRADRYGRSAFVVQLYYLQSTPYISLAVIFSISVVYVVSLRHLSLLQEGPPNSFLRFDRGDIIAHEKTQAKEGMSPQSLTNAYLKPIYFKL
jgi:hypothetical protein